MVHLEHDNLGPIYMWRLRDDRPCFIRQVSGNSTHRWRQRSHNNAGSHGINQRPTHPRLPRDAGEPRWTRSYTNLWLCYTSKREASMTQHFRQFLIYSYILFPNMSKIMCNVTSVQYTCLTCHIGAVHVFNLSHRCSTCV